MALYRVRTVFSGPAGTPWLSTLYFDDGGGSAQQAANAAGAFWGAVDAGMNTAVTWATEADVTTIDPVTGLGTGVTATTPVSGSGGAASVMLPRSSQALVRLLTGVFAGGRQIRGRIFVPGLTTADMAAGGVLTTTRRDAIAAAADAMVADVNSQLSVWSRARAREDTVVTTSTWSQFAVLRSRRD